MGVFAMLAVMISVANGYAQAPAVEWLRCYGSNYGDEPRDVKPTSDGGYIMTAYVSNSSNDVSVHFDEGSLDIWVVKINANGAIEWEISIGDKNYQFAGGVVESADGGYVVGGTTYSSSNCLLGDNSSNIILVKLSSKGEWLWEKEYGGSGNEFLSELDLSADGGFLLTGHSTSSDGDLTNNNGAEDFWIVKTDASGNIIWQKSFGGSRTDQGVSAAVAPGGGYYIVGSSESTDFDFGLNYGDSDFLILHLSERGELIWQKKFGGSNHDFAWAVSAAPDGGAVMAGMTNSVDGDVTRSGRAASDIDIWVVKVDGSGNLQWQKSFGGPKDENAFDLAPTMDGGFLLCGITESLDSDAPCTNGNTDIWVIRINGSGVIEWQKALGGEVNDFGLCIVENKDRSIMVAGITCSAGLPNYHTPVPGPMGDCNDILLVKLSPPGGTVPQPSLQIGPELVCSGIPVVLSATAINVGSHPRYEWKLNGQVVGSEATYSASNFRAGDQVSCTVTPGGICDKGSAVVTASITLKTKPDLPMPVLSIDGPELICPCQPGLFTAIVENAGPAPRFHWYVNDMLVAVGGSEYLHREAQNGDRVHYRLLDASGCLPGGYVESTGILVTVPGQEAVLQVEGPAGAVCEGERVSFRAVISGSADTGGSRWLVNGILAASGTALYETDSLRDGDRVSYMINANTACGGGGDIFSNEIAVSVRPAGGRLLIIANSSSVCRGEEMIFVAEAENGGSVDAVQWLVNGVAVAGAAGDGSYAIEGLVEQADLALLESKSAGRNQVTYRLAAA